MADNDKLGDSAPDTWELASGIQPADRELGSPLWLQVKDTLRSIIIGEQLKENAPLPSEAVLCERFQVSRSVVREAMAHLVHEGLVYRIQGKGAMVAPRHQELDFVGTTIGFSGELAARRQHVSRQVLRSEVGLPTPRIRELLGLGEETPVFYIDRVLSVDGVPRIIVRWSMPESAAPGLHSKPLESRPLYSTLGRQYGIYLSRAERWIGAVTLEEEDANLLQVPIGTPALDIESIGYNRGANHPSEYYRALYLTNQSRLHFKISTPSI
jgi:GntR family transcriptional regulator